MPEIVLPNGFTPRPYQSKAMAYFDAGGTRGVYCWPRRSGKDLTFVHQAVKAAHRRVGMYFHMLPNHKQARKVIWDAIDNDGKAILDTAIPEALRESTNVTEMKIKLKCGSVWQLVGADYYDSILGSNPVGLTMSEAALTNPLAWSYFRPILAANGGWAAFISTPRGRNWFHSLLGTAKNNPEYDWSHLTSEETGHIDRHMLEDEQRQMPDELFRQEYMCDFSAANVGAIVGRYMEMAEREGRLQLTPALYDRNGGPIHVSCDIGYRDAAAFWFWQPWADGFALIDYYEDTGLDAQEWIQRLSLLPYPVDTFWLPHDARAKTFATKHSVVQQFLEAKDTLKAKHIKLVPTASIQDRINAARTVLPSCRFDAAACAQGISALREWSFRYDEERRCYSAEPDHNWASHGSDGFTYGAQVMQQYVKPVTVPTLYAVPMTYSFNLEQLFEEREKTRAGQYFARI